MAMHLVWVQKANDPPMVTYLVKSPAEGMEQTITFDTRADEVTQTLPPETPTWVRNAANRIMWEFRKTGKLPQKGQHVS